MGASGSIQAGLAALGEDMSENLRQLDLAKGELAKADEELYKSESNKLFKDHQVLIELFTKKSKSQLAKLVQDTSIRTSDVDKLLGSDYGKFMSSLTEDSVTIDLRLAKLAMTGMGADEEVQKRWGVEMLYILNYIWIWIELSVNCPHQWPLLRTLVTPHL